MHRVGLGAWDSDTTDGLIATLLMPPMGVRIVTQHQEKTGIESRLLEEIKKRKLSYSGHILRKEGSCSEKEIIHKAQLRVVDIKFDQEHAAGRTISQYGLV